MIINKKYFCEIKPIITTKLSVHIIKPYCNLMMVTTKSCSILQLFTRTCETLPILQYATENPPNKTIWSMNFDLNYNLSCTETHVQCN